jgi:hypothetical protein
MGFKRWGMRGAQPQFQPQGQGLVDASQLFEFAVGNRNIRGVEQAKVDSSVYRLDITGIDCADARLIAAAPELLASNEALLARYVALVESGDCGFWDADAEAEPTVIAARAAIARARGEA